jgi:lantibiotic modifying enzyme
VGDLADTDRHRTTAREAVAFETTQFDHDRLKWRRQTGESVYPDRWCHGRSGILLGRREILNRLGETPGVADLTAVTERVATDPPSERDHLCCGTFGRVETLLAASDGDDRWHAAAQRLLSAPLARRERAGAFELETGHTYREPNPTLFDGLAGVTYICLRAAAPTELPCVARLD